MKQSIVVLTLWFVIGSFSLPLSGCSEKRSTQIARQKSTCTTTAPTAKGSLRRVSCDSWLED